MPRKICAVLAVALMFVLAACDGNKHSIGPNSSGDTCVGEVADNICDAVSAQQTTVGATAVVNATIRNSRGEIIGLLTKKTVNVVCTTGEGDDMSFGILIENSEAVDRFATGLINGDNFVSVGFVAAQDIDRARDHAKELDNRLRERFIGPELSTFPCDDPRVVVDEVYRHLITTPMASVEPEFQAA